MRFIDTSVSQRIPVLMELVSGLSQLSDPRDLLELCIGSMKRLGRFGCYLELSTAGLKAGQFRIARLLTHDGVDHVDLANWLEPAAMPVHSGGALARLIAAPVPKAAHDMQFGGDPVLGDKLAPYHSMVAVPVFNQGAPATWLMLFDIRPDFFRLEDLEELIIRANLVGAIVNNLQMARQLFHANLRIQQEVEHIAQIQRALLPRDHPQLPGVSIAASYETFEQAGGDMYDFVRLPRYEGSSPGDPRWVMLIGDVSGHGPSAAVVMAMFNSILHAYPHAPRGPGELLAHLNRHLCDKPIGDCFVTAFLALFDPATRRLTYARAGHPPPLLWSASSAACRRLEGLGELPLGIDGGVAYGDAEIDLAAGDLLLLYTDGINEASDARGNWFGVEGIEAAVRSVEREPSEVVRAVTAAVRRHQGTLRPRDDQTVVVVRVHDGA